MNERQKREYGIGKADILIGRLVRELHLFLAVTSTIGLGGSAASEILEILSTKASIAIATFSMLNLPGSVISYRAAGKWVRDADVVMEEYETQNGIKPSKD